MALFFAAPFGGFMLVIAAAFASWYSGMLWPALVAIMITTALTVWAPSPATRWKHNFVVRALYRYFSFRIVFSPESKFTADRPYIHVVAPHALFPIGGLLWQISPYKLARYHGRAGVASIVTRLPFWRQIFFAFGCVPAERSKLSALLEGGSHTGVAIDGIAGIFADAARPHSKPAVVMKKRKGIVRLAMRHGVPLVPVWFFVSRRPLHNLLGSSGEWISRRLKISLIWPYGRFGPFAPAVPRRAAITAVVGAPVEVGEACEAPSDAAVEAKHAELCEAMLKTFDEQKAAFGWDDRQLEIL